MKLSTGSLPRMGARSIIHSKSNVTYDKKGMPLYVRGTVQDISEIKQIQLRMEQKNPGTCNVRTKSWNSLPT